MPKMKVTAFKWVPPFAQGLVRDLRVRWALEEAGLPYEEQLISFEDAKGDSYRSRQPFCQVPAFEEDGVALFESGAIVLHLAEQHEALMPKDPRGRAQVKTWLFAAINTVEPPVTMLNVVDMQPEAVREASKPLRGAVLDRVGMRLDTVAGVLGKNDYLVGNRFSAADIMMTTVLRNLRATDLVAKRSPLEAYRLRCEARPAFKKALAAQMAPFAEHAPKAP
jgi:glutathione S-transferase